MLKKISLFIKKRRKRAGLTQIQLAERSGVGLRFLRELEQGKESVQLNKVNQVLNFFGYQIGLEEMNRDDDD